MYDWYRQNKNLFICPSCSSKLIVGNKIKCSGCRQVFQVEKGIPLLFFPNSWQDGRDVTEIVSSFYGKTGVFCLLNTFEEADETFLRSGLDVLVLENFLIIK